MGLIDNIMDNFEWYKVQRTMYALDWRWLCNDQPPTIDQLKECASMLLKTAYNECKKSGKDYTTGTGGFCAEARMVLGEVELTLSFIVSDWTVWEKDEWRY